MTMRSKQWYTKTSRLSNSFANNSISRLLDFALATRSSVRRPTESNGRRPGERRFIPGEKGAWWRELADGRARFPERTRGARPVSAVCCEHRPIPQIPPETSDLDCAVFGAPLFQSGASAQLFREDRPLCGSAPALHQSRSHS